MSNNNKTNKVGILDPQGLNPNPLTNLEYSDRYKELGQIWSKFPAYEEAEEIIKQIKDYQVTLVISGTGSGKTVLFPKYALHSFGYDGRIGITLPKKMIAKSAAEFAAETLDVEVGQEVGYQYRGSDKSARSDKTKLLYCTDGTMVARLISDPLLSEFDMVIIDEAHERKVNIDFLLYLLRNVVRKRPEFKIIIMSATIDQEIFADYFSEFTFKVIEVGGKTNYPIESIFLKKRLDIKKKEYLDEGVKIIKNLIGEIQKDTPESDTDTNTDADTDKSTGILFFVTSVSETQDICDLIAKVDLSSNVCISVYSGMDPDQERLATDDKYFVQEVGVGEKKIKLVIATNVAESSLTIEGIKYVIDSGLELGSRYDSVNRLSILEKKLITHAQAKQRMGRTGRTGPGTCYHLYLKEDFESNMEKFPIPSIRSESITTEILRLLNMEMIEDVDSLKGVLNNFIEPPNPAAVDSDLAYLKKLDMVDGDKLTELGVVTIELQVEPEEARAIVMSYRLFTFREVVAIITLSNTIKHSIPNLFTLPLDILDEEESESTAEHKQKAEWLTKKFNTSKDDFSNIYGDLIALLKIFHKYEELRDYDRKTKTEASRKKLNDWIYKKFLKREVLESAYEHYIRHKQRMRSILTRMQEETELIPHTDQTILDTNSTYRIMSCFAYGYSHNIIAIRNGVAEIELVGKNNKSKKEKIEIDPISFIDITKSKSKSKQALYFTLFKFGDTPIKAKIVTYTSDKSKEILESLLKGID